MSPWLTGTHNRRVPLSSGSTQRALSACSTGRPFPLDPTGLRFYRTHLGSSTRRQKRWRTRTRAAGKRDKHGPVRLSSAGSSDYQQTSGVRNGGWRVDAGRSLNCTCCVHECFEIRSFHRTRWFICVMKMSYLSPQLSKSVNLLLLHHYITSIG